MHSPEINTPWIPELHDIWLIKNLHYIGDKELDYPAIRKIAEFICRIQKQELREPLPEQVKATLTKQFKRLAMFVSKDTFYRRMSLDKIAKFHLQEVFMRMKDDDEPKQKKMVI